MLQPLQLGRPPNPPTIAAVSSLLSVRDLPVQSLIQNLLSKPGAPISRVARTLRVLAYLRAQIVEQRRRQWLEDLVADQTVEAVACLSSK